MTDDQVSDAQTLDAPTVAVTVSVQIYPALVHCQICLEDVELDNVTVALAACGHRFCTACITAFLTVQITDGGVDLACFHTDDHGTMCATEIVCSDIERLVSPSIMAKYERFRLLRTHVQARECPFCRFVQVTTGSTEYPICLCSACDRYFCFLHADAHALDETCAQFEKRQSKRERKSGRVVKRISRPCPQCAQPIEKNGGCVHMTCAACKAEFCWWCGATWGFNYGRHYSLLDAECCSGIAHELVPGLDSPYTLLRLLVRFGYFLALMCIGVPTTLVLLVMLVGVWAPAVYRGEYKIRFFALMRFFGIRFVQLMIMIGYVVAVIVAFVVLIFADVLGWLTRKIRTLVPTIRAPTLRCCLRPRDRSVEAKAASESDVDSPVFVVLPDLERGDEQQVVVP